MNIFDIIFNTIKKINFVDLSAIFVNLSILWIFYKTYFSKNLKVLSINSGFNTFFWTKYINYYSKQNIKNFCD